MKNGRRPQKKNEMEDDLNFKAVLLSLFNNKKLKKNGFDTIEIDLVSASNAPPNFFILGILFIIFQSLYSLFYQSSLQFLIVQVLLDQASG